MSFQNHCSRSNLLEVHEMQALPEGRPMTSRRITDEINDDQGLGSTLVGKLLVFGVGLLLITTFPLSLFYCFIVVYDHEKAVLFRNGRLRRDAMGPGLVFTMPVIDRFFIIDCRLVCYNIPPQTLLTKDSITITVDAVVLYRVHNCVVAVTNVEDYTQAIELLAATSLRNILGTKTLAQVLSDCNGINDTLRTTLDVITDFWGVRVERIDIMNVHLPRSLQTAMSAEAQAYREARAKYIQATGEQQSARLLCEAGTVMDTHPCAIHLRYLQTLNTITDNGSKTIVVPFPTELFQM